MSSQPKYHLLMMLFVRNYVLILQLLLLDCSSAFSYVTNYGRLHISLQTSFLGMSSSAAHDLLYQDQQAAMERRALKEQELLSTKKVKELKAPKLKIPAPKSGTGFGGSSSGKKAIMSPIQRLASEQAKIVHREGVIRINQALSVLSCCANRARLEKPCAGVPLPGPPISLPRFVDVRSW